MRYFKSGLTQIFKDYPLIYHMLDKFKLDKFAKNIIIVFAGSSLANFLGLFCQLVSAHKLSSVDFAVFNSLIAIFNVIATPLGAFQPAVAKYIAHFHAKNQINCLEAILSKLLKITLWLIPPVLLIFFATSGFLADKLKISSVEPVHILSILIISSWIGTFLGGALQGLEKFS